MQIHGPGGVVDGIPVKNYGTKGCQALEFPIGFSVVLETPEDCDEVIKAAVEAKARMLAAREPEHDHDADLPWTTAHKFIPCTTCSEDACNACGRPKASYVHVLEGTVTGKPADAPYAEKLATPVSHYCDSGNCHVCGDGTGDDPQPTLHEQRLQAARENSPAVQDGPYAYLGRDQ